jgi:hypothetical protein
MTEIEKDKIYFEARWLDEDGKAKGGIVYFTREFLQLATLPLSAVDHSLKVMIDTALEGFLGEDYELLQKESHAQTKERKG